MAPLLITDASPIDQLIDYTDWLIGYSVDQNCCRTAAATNRSCLFKINISFILHEYFISHNQAIRELVMACIEWMHEAELAGSSLTDASEEQSRDLPSGTMITRPI